MHNSEDMLWSLDNANLARKSTSAFFAQGIDLVKVWQELLDDL